MNRDTDIGTLTPTACLPTNQNEREHRLRARHRRIRERRYEIIPATSVPERTRVASAFTPGSRPTRSLAQISTGSVWSGPIVKEVMTNSSRESDIEIRAAPMID